MVPPAKTTAPSEKGNDWCPPPSCFNYLHGTSSRHRGSCFACRLNRLPARIFAKAATAGPVLLCCCYTSNCN